MSKEETLNKENSKRKFSDWFWDITTRWYFFPVFYVLLALILSKESDGGILYSLFLMPVGISYFIHLTPWNKNLPLFYYVIPIFSVIAIQYYRIKKKKVIKWLIITLLLYLLLNFYGCHKMLQVPIHI